MKATISVPDATFEAASRRGRELGMSRSEFFSRAAAHYLAALDAASLTVRIDAALTLGSDQETEAAVVHAGLTTLRESDEQW